MGRFKVKKQDTFIDMTPMSDVMVLLLTFFMLTATFVKEEPVKVNAPGSVSEIKIPDANLLTIFVEKTGKVFLTMDNPTGQTAMLDEVMTRTPSLKLTDEQQKSFRNCPTFGTPLNVLSSWLDLEPAERNLYLNKNEKAGVPCDSLNDELKVWVEAARNANGENMRIAIKADQHTSYAVIKKVMDSLRSIHENRYNLITALKNGEE